MSQIFISKHGIVIRIRSLSAEHSEILKALKFDFAEFASSPAMPHIAIDLVEQIPSRRLRHRYPIKIWSRDRIRIYGVGAHRICQYATGAEAETRGHQGMRTFWIAGQQATSIREVAYNIVMSALGEELDVQGYHRIHGFAFEVRERRFLLAANSGAGKSSMALQLTRCESVRFYSDESPLIRKATIYPFPNRMALAASVAQSIGFESDHIFVRPSGSQKMLFPFPHDRQAKPAAITDLVVVKAGTDDPIIQEFSRYKAIPALVLGLVVGYGLPQMAEWMLRGSALMRLIGIALHRLVTMFQILWSVDSVYLFTTGPDAVANANCLKKFLALQDEKPESQQPMDRSEYFRERPSPPTELDMGPHI